MDVLEYRNPDKLKNHPLSIQLYGDQLTKEFVDSVTEVGIKLPLRILRDGTIIAGRRRRILACKLLSNGDKRFAKVPCVVIDGKPDDLDIQAEIIHTNRENDRTVEQRAREFKELHRIESEKSAIRMKQAPIKARSEKDAVSNLTQHEIPDENDVFGPKNDQDGKAVNIASEAVGMSRNTATKALEVVEVIDALEQAGKTEEAQELRERLESSVSAAHREVMEQEKEDEPVTDPAGNKLPKRIQDAFEIVKQFRGIINKIGSITTSAEEMAKERGGEGLPLSAIKLAAKDFQSCFSAAMPYALCPYCKGHKCAHCKDRGWITQDGWNGIPKTKREEMLK